MKPKNQKQAVNIIHNILVNKECLHSSEILFYIQGLLPPKGQQEIENHLLSCPVCILLKEIYEEFETNPYERAEAIIKAQLEDIEEEE